MYVIKEYTDYDAIKSYLLFLAIFVLITLVNWLLANVIFKLPGQIHWALLPVAIIGLYVHFCLICMDSDTEDIYYLRGRGKLLLPVVFYRHMLIKLIPRIKNQEWHKHRGLIIVGPINLIICLAIIYFLRIPLSWPTLPVSVFTVVVGYYSLSFFAIAWVKIGELWEKIK